MLTKIKNWWFNKNTPRLYYEQRVFYDVIKLGELTMATKYENTWELSKFTKEYNLDVDVWSFIRYYEANKLEIEKPKEIKAYLKAKELNNVQ